MPQKIIKILKKSLIFSFFLIVVPIVFSNEGFAQVWLCSKKFRYKSRSGVFYLLRKNKLIYFWYINIFSNSLTLSSIDTIINTISSLIIVDGKNIINLKLNYINPSNICTYCNIMYNYFYSFFKRVEYFIFIYYWQFIFIKLAVFSSVLWFL